MENAARAEFALMKLRRDKEGTMGYLFDNLDQIANARFFSSSLGERHKSLVALQDCSSSDEAIKPVPSISIWLLS